MVYACPPPSRGDSKAFLNLLLVNLHHGLLAPLIGPFPFPQPCVVCFILLLKPQWGLLVQYENFDLISFLWSRFKWTLGFKLTIWVFYWGEATIILVKCHVQTIMWKCKAIHLMLINPITLMCLSLPSSNLLCFQPKILKPTQNNKHLCIKKMFT
jgi:hypothetical protein